MNIVKSPKYPCNQMYTEIGQSNPIRWTLLVYNEEEKCYHPVAKQFKCKDYLNDVAYLYTHKESRHQNTDHEQFGLYVGKLPYEEMRLQKGIFLKLDYLIPQWFDNIVKYLEPFCKEQGAPMFEVVEKGNSDDGRQAAIVFLPEYFLQTTMTISIITWLIRVCNYELYGDDVYSLKFDTSSNDWHAMYKQGSTYQYQNRLKQYGLLPPKELIPQVALISPHPYTDKPQAENYDVGYAFSSIHNAGFASVIWIPQQLKAMGVSV